MVRVKQIHRGSGKTFLSEPMPITDAMLWISEALQDGFNRCDMEIIPL
jgi:hypothetical protein